MKIKKCGSWKNWIEQTISFKVKFKPDPQPPLQPDPHPPVHFEEQEEKRKPREITLGLSSFSFY